MWTGSSNWLSTLEMVSVLFGWCCFFFQSCVCDCHCGWSWAPLAADCLMKNLPSGRGTESWSRCVWGLLCSGSSLRLTVASLCRRLVLTLRLRLMQQEHSSSPHYRWTQLDKEKLPLFCFGIRRQLIWRHWTKTHQWITARLMSDRV